MLHCGSCVIEEVITPPGRDFLHCKAHTKNERTLVHVVVALFIPKLKRKRLSAVFTLPESPNNCDLPAELQYLL